MDELNDSLIIKKPFLICQPKYITSYEFPCLFKAMSAISFIWRGILSASKLSWHFVLTDTIYIDD